MQCLFEETKALIHESVFLRKNKESRIVLDLISKFTSQNSMKINL